ncbi:DUF262 domain-containing protein [Nocardia gamkensis]|uniref:DUF262 domain-containing protein n=1 Tax=Nocardia gamkensis TaxID=352869 RepID=UPI0037C627E0
MIKSVDNVPVYTLLSPENTIVYRIPPYQREYSWSKQQWDDLFDDLLESDGDQGHFLGTIICVNQTANSTQEVVLELIDGQQRMTTLSLLLIAIHQCLETRREQLDEDDITDLTNLRRQLVLRKPVRARLRPQKQNSNFEDYLNVLSRAGIEIESPKVKNLGNRRIMKAYNHFVNRILVRAEEPGRDVVGVALDMLGRVKNATLVKLEVVSHSDAYVLFESLNNRGLPLTPIDLIKNNLLASSDKEDGLDTDKVFVRWNDLLADLGDDYTNQERFFRQYYNAFKATLPPVLKAPVATRSNLIRIYETLIAADLAAFLDGITTAGSEYKRIIGNLDDEDPRTTFDDALVALSRAQGSPSHILLLFLMIRRAELELTERHLEGITRLLASFFVRRNLTGVPQTYMLQGLFMDLIERVTPLRGEAVEGAVREGLRRVSASDEQFLGKLRGQIYDENADVARFILVSLAERSFTKETWTDLWARERTHYKWTIEHILPQGGTLPSDWVDMLGGNREHAADVQQRLVHTLGNLTITGFNSSLGNRSFDYKKNRKDSHGNYIGFRNGLSLNADVAASEKWTEEEITRRTELLARRTLDLFPI